ELPGGVANEKAVAVGIGRRRDQHSQRVTDALRADDRQDAAQDPRDVGAGKLATPLRRLIIRLITAGGAPVPHGAVRRPPRHAPPRLAEDADVARPQRLPLVARTG